jgi:hypothetical protein
MNWPWPPPRGEDVAGIFIAIAIAGIVLVVFTKYPHVGPLGRTANQGFGSDWNCDFPGSGDPVCIRKSPASPANSN